VKVWGRKRVILCCDRQDMIGEVVARERVDLPPGHQAIRPVQGWPPTGHRVVRVGKALKTLSKFNPVFDTVRITVPWAGGGDPENGEGKRVIVRNFP
jgi:hypothetical protein